jgi:pSer/pThr/pTyr-binding forkhead associated (FHA) protein
MTPEFVVFILRLFLGLALYIFLGSLLVAFWRDLRQARTGSTVVPQAVLAFQLPADQEPLIFPLLETNLVGRAPDNSIILRDDTVSARHARINYTAGQWILEDLGSKNGTFVNDMALEGPLVVTYGDRLGFGSLQAVLRQGTLEGGERSPELQD